MQDLYSTLFYKISFTIETKNSQVDLLGKVISHIKTWMTNKHNSYGKINLPTEEKKWTPIKTGGTVTGNNVRIESEFFENPEMDSMPFWACEIIEVFQKGINVAPRTWTTEIGLEPIEKGKSVFSCIISYSDRPGFIGKCDERPYPSIPKIIKFFLKDEELLCYNGMDKLTTEPQIILSGHWLEFWEKLNNSNRMLPYIYISPQSYIREGESVLLIKPQELATATGGNAIVYFADDPEVTEEMNYCCPEEYMCYGGAIRIYYPNLNTDIPGDDRKHRYLGRRYICENGETSIIQMIHRAIAQDAHSSDQLFRMRDCKAKKEEYARKKRLEVLTIQHSEEIAERERTHENQIKSVQENEECALSLALEAEKKQLEAEDFAASIEADNKKLREENYNLKVANESYISMAKENADLKKVCDNRLTTKSYPKTPREIVQYFDAVFGDKIAFSDDAMGSLKGCIIPFDKLWEALFALSTIMQDLYVHGGVNIFQEFRTKSGIDVSSGEGTMTRQNKKLMRQFKTEYHGETIDIEPHITYSKIKQSIHFGFSEKDRKVVVGWCGEHKDNYTTRKVH